MLCFNDLIKELSRKRKCVPAESAPVPVLWQLMEQWFSFPQPVDITGRSERGSYVLLALGTLYISL